MSTSNVMRQGTPSIGQGPSGSNETLIKQLFSAKVRRMAFEEHLKAGAQIAQEQKRTKPSPTKIDFEPLKASIANVAAAGNLLEQQGLLNFQEVNGVRTTSADHVMGDIQENVRALTDAAIQLYKSKLETHNKSDEKLEERHWQLRFDALQMENEELKEGNRKLQERYRNLEEGNDNLEKKYRTLRKRNGELEENNDDLEGKNKKLKQGKDKLELEYGEAETRAEEAEQEVEQIRGDLQASRDHAETGDARIAELETQKRHLEERLAAAEAPNNGQHSNAQTLRRHRRDSNERTAEELSTAGGASSLLNPPQDLSQPGDRSNLKRKRVDNTRAREAATTNPKAPRSQPTTLPWSIAEVLEDNDFDKGESVPECVWVVVRQQLDKWSQKYSSRLSTATRKRVCAASYCRGVSTDWVAGGENTTCLRCRKGHGVCIVIQGGRMDVLPLGNASSNLDLENWRTAGNE